MIALAFIIVTDLEEIPTADIIEFQYGTEEFGFGGDMIRDFIKTVKKGEVLFENAPEQAVLHQVMRGMIPPPFRGIFEIIYCELKDIII